jgi:hypothetical protein
MDFLRTPLCNNKITITATTIYYNPEMFQDLPAFISALPGWRMEKYIPGGEFR